MPTPTRSEIEAMTPEQRSALIIASMQEAQAAMDRFSVAMRAAAATFPEFFAAVGALPRPRPQPRD